MADNANITQVAGSQSPSTIESRDTRLHQMQEVNSLCTDSQTLRAEHSTLYSHLVLIWCFNQQHCFTGDTVGCEQSTKENQSGLLEQVFYTPQLSANQ